MPPSPHPATALPYGWEHRPIVALPREARAALCPTPRILRPTSAVSPVGRARQADALLRSVRTARDGRRNDVLYWAARRALDEGHAEALLDLMEVTD
jgi:hypothetical protein